MADTNDPQNGQNPPEGDNQTQTGADDPQGESTPPQGDDAPKGNTVNAVKHMREVNKLKAENQELKDQLKASKEEAEGYKAIGDEFHEWKAEQEREKIDGALKAKGCHDTVAARARLDEFDGDIDKLKEAAPYLFTSTDNTQSTGGTQKGAPNPEDERTKKMRETFGLKND